MEEMDFAFWKSISISAPCLADEGNTGAAEEKGNAKGEWGEGWSGEGLNRNKEIRYEKNN